MANKNEIAEAGTIVKKESNGSITFANDVIATIAGLAAIDVPGVAGMSGGFVDGFVEMLGRKMLGKGVKVEVGSEEVAVDLTIVVEYGVSIQDVAQNIQMAVIKAVETMTGLKVVEVNISVQGIKFKDQAPIASEAKEQKNGKTPRVK